MMDKSEVSNNFTFWQHLEELRGCIFKILIAVIVFSVLAFVFKDFLFTFLLAPKSPTFITYKILKASPFEITLINTLITGQFMMHLKVAVLVGVILASPYILYVLYRFIAPGLYSNEKRYSFSIVAAAYVMFCIGVSVSYLFIFPLTLRFLATYSVSEEVGNLLTLNSYMDTLLTLSLVFGIVFEIPVLSWLLAKFGLLRASWMVKFRKHAIVVILIAAAIITPTGDPITLGIVFLPIWLLYEASILVVKATSKRRKVITEPTLNTNS